MLIHKRRGLPPLHALRAFEAAARHLSFKVAAEELAVTPTAVSHHVRLLEDVLRVKLFERRPRAVVLTRPGKELYPALREGLDTMTAAISRLRADASRTVVTVSATVAFAARWLVPRVSAFHRAYPALDLRLHASDDPVDLRSGTVDVAIRYGSGEYPGLVSEPLVEDEFAPVCSPSLGLRQPEELSGHSLIHFEWRQPRRENPTWSRWLEQTGLGQLRPRANLVFSDESHAIQATIAAQGVILASLVLVSDEIQRGILTTPFGPRLRGYRYSLVYAQRARDAEGVRALREWIHAELRTELQMAAPATGPAGG